MSVVLAVGWKLMEYRPSSVPETPLQISQHRRSQMPKSLRSKKRRLRTLTREIAEPFYDKKEAALAAPKLAVITPASVDEEPAAVTSAAMDNLLAGEANEQKKKLDEIFMGNQSSSDFERNISSFLVSYRLDQVVDAKKAAEAEARSTEEALARARYKLKLLGKEKSAIEKVLAEVHIQSLEAKKAGLATKVSLWEETLRNTSDELQSVLKEKGEIDKDLKIADAYNNISTANVEMTEREMKRKRKRKGKKT